jgi:hypothetical protein
MSTNTVVTEALGKRLKRLPESLRTKPRYGSDEASVYLSIVHGVTAAPRTLDKMRSVGGGPFFAKFNGRALYLRADLDAWVRLLQFLNTRGVDSFWCPWCRTVHRHGAAGRDGNRAHCHDKSSPFFGHGIDLLFAGTVQSDRGIECGRAVVLIPQMSPQEVVALSNHLTGVGGDYIQWRPLLDAAGNAVVRRARS